MRYPATIGKNYELTLRRMTDPTFEFFIPDPKSEMPCAQLSSYYDQLDRQLLDWQAKYDSGSNKEKKNLARIMEIQLAKQIAYQNEMDKKQCFLSSDPVTTPANEPGQATTQTTTTASGGNNMLLIAAAAIAVILIMRK